MATDAPKRHTAEAENAPGQYSQAYVFEALFWTLRSLTSIHHNKD